MSDKLKIMQTRTTGDHNFKEVDLFCASIGYADLKALPDCSRASACVSSEQPELDEFAFSDYVSKAEFIALTAPQAA